MDWSLTKRALELLGESGIPVDSSRFFDLIGVYHRLCSTWNLSAKLLSKGDLVGRFDEHVAD